MEWIAFEMPLFKHVKVLNAKECKENKAGDELILDDKIYNKLQNVSSFGSR